MTINTYCHYRETFLRWLAFKLPLTLVWWVTLRVMINSPDDKYSGQEVPDISTHEALNRWSRRVYCDGA